MRWSRTFVLLLVCTLSVRSRADDSGTRGHARDAADAGAYPHALLSELTLGMHGGEEEFESYVDVLVPLHYAPSLGLLFFAPRASATDADEEEVNLGLGWRFLFPDKCVIVGLNAYYDSRWSVYGSRWDQFGAGVELLTEWVDARANYYLPDDAEQLVNRFEIADTNVTSSSQTWTEEQYGDVEPRGNAFRQEVSLITRRRTVTRTTITTHVFEQFEAALEGFDAEIGFRLPFIDELAETRLFVGYQSFDHPSGDDLEGIKGRVEIRARPGLFIDGELFEEETLNGTDYFVGARLSVPCDLSAICRGENPFAGAAERFVAARRSGMTGRLTEMVMRDVKVHSAVTDPREDPALMSQTTTVKSSTRTIDKDEDTITVLGDVVFVDNAAGAKQPAGARGAPKIAGPAGTAEDPVPDVQQGIDMAEKRRMPNVYVFRGVDVYRGNFVIQNLRNFLGQGVKIRGMGGRSYGGGRPPVLNAADRSRPTLSIHGGKNPLDIRVAGMHFKNCAEKNGLPFVPQPKGLNVLAQSKAGGAMFEPGSRAVRVNDVARLRFDHNIVSRAAAGLTIEQIGLPDFDLLVEDNVFRELGGGLWVRVLDANGRARLRNNFFEQTGASILLTAVGNPIPARLDARVTGNRIEGGASLLLAAALEKYGVAQKWELPKVPGLKASSGIVAASLGDAEVHAAIRHNRVDGKAYGILGAAAEGASLHLAVTRNQVSGAAAAAPPPVANGGAPGRLLPGLPGGDQFAGKKPPLLAGIPLLGIGALAFAGGNMDGLVIRDNTVSGVALAICALAAADGSMREANLRRNRVDHAVLGILAAGVLGGKMHGLNVERNRIREALLGIAVANVLGINQGMEIKRNHIREALLGITVANVLGINQGMEIKRNHIREALLAITVANVLGINQGMEVKRNHIRQALMGIVALNLLGRMNDMEVNANRIDDTVLLGILVANLAGQMNDMELNRNRIDDPWCGIGSYNAGEMNDAELQDNWVHDVDVGIGIVNDGTMDGLDLDDNEIHASWFDYYMDGG